MKSKVNAATWKKGEHYVFPFCCCVMEMLISFCSRSWHLPKLPGVTIPDLMTAVSLCQTAQYEPYSLISSMSACINEVIHAIDLLYAHRNLHTFSLGPHLLLNGPYL